jgi:hypothetical protein
MGSLLERVILVSAGSSIPWRESHPESRVPIPDKNCSLSRLRTRFSVVAISLWRGCLMP